MKNELMMIIINKEGMITGMYSDEDFIRTTSVDELLKYVRAKNKEGRDEERLDYIGRLLCIKRYASDNYPGMELSNDYLSMYYKLVQQGDIILVNYKLRNNLLIAPGETTSEQKEVLKDITRVFNPHSVWTMSDNVYLETFEHNGRLMGAVVFGDIQDGKLAPYVSYLIKKDKVKEIGN